MHALDHALEWLRKEVVEAPLTPVLHPSPRRMKGLGLFMLFGHPLFFLIWSKWLPQPYENLALRCTAALLGFLLMIRPVSEAPSSRLAGYVFSLVFWFELPLLFSWMYLCNSGDPVWLASICTMVATYYYVTDWRIATGGLAFGAAVGWLLFHYFGPAVRPITDAEMLVNSVTIFFSVSMGLLLGISSANLRREQLANTLATIGIMAHELRTPLSTAALLGDALQLEVKRQPDHPRAGQLDKLAVRLHALVRNMNRQIDSQISNARLLQLPHFSQRVTAAKLVRDTVNAYPFAATRQRDCVRVVVRQDFTFRGSPIQFTQVLDNLIKNALHSLMAADSRYPTFALRILVGVERGKGLIVVEDDGMGIEPTLLSQIFKPFVSNNKSTGHGLGLAFCYQVVRAAGGTINVKSAYAVGAAFTIELPIIKDAT